MNRLVKGSIAGAAGIVLLLGGAGTFAFWNDSVGVQAGPIVAGQLSVEDDGVAGAWTDANGDSIDPATYRIVPGDELTFTDNLTVTAEGDNLTATLGLANTGHGGSSTDANDVALANAVVPEFTLTASGSAIDGAPISPDTYSIKSGTGTGTVTFTVDVSLPFGDAGDFNDAQLGSVVFGSDVVLTQNG